jgi:fructose-bisphosphate aldolase class I
MDIEKLEATAKQLVQNGKGVLAADESNGSCEKRFDAVGVACTEESRRQYRQILLTTPGIADSLSGVILYDETFWQKSDSGQQFPEYLRGQNILAGIKVDLGLIDLPGFPNEKLTKGLDDLPERIAKYAENGATFAKWRSVITIGEGGIPTDECIGANTFVLARYARICQDNGIVPMVEPEVLFDGTHSIERCEEVIAHVYDILFQTMRAFRVHLPGAILKTSMVLPGKASGVALDAASISEKTVRVLHEHAPQDLGGVVFLSGGQTSRDAYINLNRIKQRGPHPWGVTFSYSRALQDSVLKAWAKNPDDLEAISGLYKKQLAYAVAATNGQLNEAELTDDDFVSHSQD